MGMLALTGFGVRIATALLATILEVAWRGWSFLDVTLIPASSLIHGFALGRTQPGPTAGASETVESGASALV